MPVSAPFFLSPETHLNTLDYCCAQWPVGLSVTDRRPDLMLNFIILDDVLAATNGTNLFSAICVAASVTTKDRRTYGHQTTQDGVSEMSRLPEDESRRQPARIDAVRKRRL